MLFRGLTQLWRDQCGGISVASQILLTVILAIGGITGLIAFRNQVVQEFGDLAVALESLDQSYTTSTCFFKDTATTLTDDMDMPPAGLNLTAPATPEGT